MENIFTKGKATVVNSLLCLIFSDWSLEMAIVAGRQEREILIIRKDSRKEQAVVSTGLLPF